MPTVIDSSAAKFYVYEHWRSDKDECFWVGKGHGQRAWEFRRRNKHHLNITAKVRSLGGIIEVRIIRDGLSEPEALAFEIERIAYWRAANGRLANITDGGEGVSGLKHSEETRKKIKEAIKGIIRRPTSEETKEKIRAAQIGKKRGPNPEHSARLKGRKLSAIHRAKIGVAHIGKKRSARTCTKISAALKGRKASSEARINMAASQTGKFQSQETKDKRAASTKRYWDNHPEERLRRRDSVLKAYTADVRAKLSVKMKKRVSSPEGRAAQRRYALIRWGKVECK